MRCGRFGPCSSGSYNNPLIIALGMPRNSRSEASLSESENDDAPESISLSRSKKDTQKLEAERRNAEVMQRREKREKNRNTDKKLKERALTNKKGKALVGGSKGTAVVERKKRKRVDAEKDEGHSDKGGEPDQLEKRMRRAMKDAEEEGELESNGEEFMGIDKGEDDDGSNFSDDKRAVRNPDHLPDELFAAAFSSLSKRKILEEDLRPPATKRRKKSSSSKDTIVGFVLQSKSTILFQSFLALVRFAFFQTPRLLLFPRQLLRKRSINFSIALLP